MSILLKDRMSRVIVKQAEGTRKNAVGSNLIAIIEGWRMGGYRKLQKGED